MLPVLTGAVAATGFYFGAEIVTIAAAEAAEPAKAVAEATNWVISRALFFYVGSVLLVVCLVPWNSPGIATPYVSALEAMGIPAAAQLMNAVVLTAVLSALNSGLYASSRMLFALTRRGDAPQAPRQAQPQRRSDPGHPAGHLVRLRAVVMSYVSPDTVFAFLVNSYGTVAIFVYVLIALSQLRLRARLERESPERLRVRMWGYPYLTYFAICGMTAIVVAMGFIPEQRAPLVFRPPECGDFAAGIPAAPPARRPKPRAGDRANHHSRLLLPQSQYCSNRSLIWFDALPTSGFRGTASFKRASPGWTRIRSARRPYVRWDGFMHSRFVAIAQQKRHLSCA